MQTQTWRFSKAEALTWEGGKASVPPSCSETKSQELSGRQGVHTPSLPSGWSCRTLFLRDPHQVWVKSALPVLLEVPADIICH